MTNSLLDFLKTKKEEAESQAVDAETVRTAWQAALKALFADLVNWLAPAEKAGLLRHSSEDIQIVEDHLGTYVAPSLRIAAPANRNIDIVPKGRLVVGAEGRVDIRSGPRRSMLVRRDGKWSFARQGAQPGRWTYIDLSEEAFSEELEMLLS